VTYSGSKDRNRALEGDVVAIELLDVDDVWGTKKEKEEKKRRKEETASYDPRNAAAASSAAYLRKQDKKNDDVEVEGQGMTLFDDLDDLGPADDVQPQYAGHVVGVVHRTPGQLFAGTLGVLRPSSAATKEKQEAERREREGVDLRAGSRQDAQPIRIVWLRPVDKR
jgi:protein SSD1